MNVPGRPAAGCDASWSPDGRTPRSRTADEVLEDARDRGLIDADVLAMLEGVLQVSEIQVRDVMVPRSQMVVVRRDDAPEQILRW